MDIVVDSQLERVHNITENTAEAQANYGEHTYGQHFLSTTSHQITFQSTALVHTLSSCKISPDYSEQ